MFVPSVRDDTLNYLYEKGVSVKRFSNILSEDAVSEITADETDLGVIIGGRILSESLIHWPRLGSLNIHKHDCEKYRGGAQVGYPECKNHDRTLTITIHYATTQVDAGDILQTVDIPIEPYDNDQSLEIKAAVAGFELYLKVIRDIRDGTASRRPQSLKGAKMLYTSPYLARALLWRNRRKQHRTALRKSNPLPSRFLLTLCRNILAILAFPALAIKRRNQEATGQAPVLILYYHGVSNSAENWMHLPLERFHEQVAYLKKYFQIVDLEAAVDTLRNGHSSKLSVVLTFDDGYKSLHDILLPYLSYHSIPATFFVCPESSSENSLHEHDRQNGCFSARLMSTKEIRACADRSITIGSHGQRHENMALLSRIELEKTMGRSFNSLDLIDPQSTRFFSFPFGHESHVSAESILVAKKFFKAGFSASGGYNTPNAPTQFLYNRIANPTDFFSLVAIANGMHRIRLFYTGKSLTEP